MGIRCSIREIDRIGEIEAAIHGLYFRAQNLLLLRVGGGEKRLIAIRKSAENIVVRVGRKYELRSDGEL